MTKMTKLEEINDAIGALTIQFPQMVRPLTAMVDHGAFISAHAFVCGAVYALETTSGNDWPELENLRNLLK